MQTMHAVRAHHRGGPEAMRYEDAPMPVAGAGEVLVAVHAAAVTPGELEWDASWESEDGADRTPIIPSHEFSGVVVETGEGMGAWAAGTEVFGLIDFHRDGAAAEYVVLPAAALAERPGRLTHVQCAALPLAGLTAWQALSDHARVGPKERVLVQGGAGGVGSLVVQLAKALGAHVTATAAGPAQALVTGLGADVVVASIEALQGGGAEPFDVLVDTFGGPVPVASYGLLRPGGRLVTLSQPPDQQLAAQARIQAVFFVVHPDPSQLGQLAALADRGALVPVIARTLPLSAAAEAYAPAPAPHRPGKTVLVVRP
jgi:NADPH:quinone reductase-like Zn-dependent oxidoreductase